MWGAGATRGATAIKMELLRLLQSASLYLLSISLERCKNSEPSETLLSISDLSNPGAIGRLPFSCDILNHT